MENVNILVSLYGEKSGNECLIVNDILFEQALKIIDVLSNRFSGYRITEEQEECST